MAEPPIPNTTIFLKFPVKAEVETEFEVEAGKKLAGTENSSPKPKASLIF
ncbi:hypothetical protein ES705_48426 [subsurface metagenome]